MLFIIAFSMIAAVFFQREATRRGYDARKAAYYPLTVGGVAVVLCWIATAGMKLILPRLGASADMTRMLGWLTEIFFLFCVFGAIAKNWRIIRRLPFRKKPEDGEGGS